MNWKALLIGIIFYVVLGTFFGNYFKSELGFLSTVIVAFIAGVITALLSKRQFVRHGMWVGFLGGILIGVILVTLVLYFPIESRILFPFDEGEILRTNIFFVFLLTTLMFTVVGMIGSAIGSFITGLIYKKIGGKIIEEKTKKESVIPPKTWWIFIIFGILGGIVGYIKLKNRNKKMAKNILIGGVITSIISVIMMTSIGIETGTLNISPITDPIRKSIYGSGYATFSDGMVMEYPTSWYTDNYDFYPTNDLTKRAEMKVSILDHTYLLSKNGINSASSALEFWLGEFKDFMDFELISKDLSDDISTAKLKYISQGKTTYFYYKIIRCNEKIFELHINSEEPKNLEYATEIDRMISSFRCK